MVILIGFDKESVQMSKFKRSSPTSHEDLSFLQQQLNEVPGARMRKAMKICERKFVMTLMRR